MDDFRCQGFGCFGIGKSGQFVTSKRLSATIADGLLHGQFPQHWGDHLFSQHLYDVLSSSQLNPSKRQQKTVKLATTLSAIVSGFMYRFISGGSLKEGTSL